MLKKYQASMILAGVGDALGYKHGQWESLTVTTKIHQEVALMGGVKKIHVKLPEFNVSDSTVMLLATAEALVSMSGQKDKSKLFLKLASSYQECMPDITERDPGLTYTDRLRLVNPHEVDEYCIPFNPRGGGCEAATRAMCIGLRYPTPDDLNDLVVVSIEAGRVTHHHPTGYLGALTTALFTSYGIQEKPLLSWGAGLMSVLPIAKEYVKSSGKFITENLESWNNFESAWEAYLKLRGISDGVSEPAFTADDDVVEKRDLLWKSWSQSGKAGASGHDAPMIAYDALMQSETSWTELCMRAVLHGGDNDSTGVIAGAWFGALYAMPGVPDCHYQDLEYCDRLINQATKLMEMTKLVQ